GDREVRWRRRARDEQGLDHGDRVLRVRQDVRVAEPVARARMALLIGSGARVTALAGRSTRERRRSVVVVIEAVAAALDLRVFEPLARVVVEVRERIGYVGDVIEPERVRDLLRGDRADLLDVGTPDV